MALVNYATSSEDEDDQPQRQAKRIKTKHDQKSDQKSLPPLPSSFRDLYSTSARASSSDDPSIHNGRKRAIPHKEGVWPSHIYLEWLPTSTQAEHLQQVIDNVADDTSDLETSIRSNLGVPLPLHISLSCTLPVLTEHRSAFLAAVEDALKNLRAQLEPFTIRLQDCVWAANFERNRWFLALIAKSLKGAELEVLLNVCNEVVRSFDMMALYPTLKSSTDRHSKFERAESISKSKNPVAGPTDTDDSFEKSPFHFSIASTVHPVLSKEDSLALVDINDEVMNRVRGMKIAIDKVKVKIGNAVHSIPLSCPPEDATQRKFFS